MVGSVGSVDKNNVYFYVPEIWKTDATESLSIYGSYCTT